MIQTQTLIVGGGLSGLAIADHMTRNGTDFLLVEAQDRLGGRILTKDLSGGTFDLGPAWFWPGQSRLSALTRRFQIPVFEQFATGDLLYQDQSGAIQRGQGGASMQGSYRLAGGMGVLIDGLTGALPPERAVIRTRLSKIQRANDGVVAHLVREGTSLTVAAKQVVLAVPPRVIADTVAFEPELGAAQLQSLKNVPTWMAGQAKIIATYDEPHWRKKGLSGDAISHQGPMVEIHDASPMAGGPSALFGFVGVPANARITHRHALLDQSLAQLTLLFGPEMAHPRESGATGLGDGPRDCS